MVLLTATGMLGKDAVCYSKDDKYVINFTLASNKTYKDPQGNKQTITTWVDCAYWTKSDALVQWLKKSTIVMVSGEAQVNVYTKTDGTPGHTLKCLVKEIDFYTKPTA